MVHHSRLSLNDLADAVLKILNEFRLGGSDPGVAFWSGHESFYRLGLEFHLEENLAVVQIWNSNLLVGFYVRFCLTGSLHLHVCLYLTLTFDTLPK